MKANGIPVKEAYILRASGVLDYTLLSEEDWFEEVSIILGGMVEPVNYVREHIGEMYVNEEGIPLGLQPNLLAYALFDRQPFGNTVFRGNVVLMKKGMNAEVRRNIDLLIASREIQTKEWFDVKGDEEE